MMNKKAGILALLLLLLSACDKNKNFLYKEPVKASTKSFATVEEGPSEQPQFLTKKSEKEKAEEKLLPPFGGSSLFPGPEAIPNQLLAPPPPPIATDDDLAPPLIAPGPAVFPFARCGNGGRFPEGVEQCDFGDINKLNTAGCNIVCGKPFCGNGVTESLVEILPTITPIITPIPSTVTRYKEECDDGNNENGDGCSENCLFERCGNARIDPDEECDDGNNIDGDGCSRCCLVEKCGNGRADKGEECDDGNLKNGDGCTDCCKREPKPSTGGL